MLGDDDNSLLHLLDLKLGSETNQKTNFVLVIPNDKKKPTLLVYL